MSLESRFEPPAACSSCGAEIDWRGPNGALIEDGLATCADCVYESERVESDPYLEQVAGEVDRPG
jgi:hypothetical protein